MREVHCNCMTLAEMVFRLQQLLQLPFGFRQHFSPVEG